MVKTLAFLKRREGLDAAAFRDYYENHHVPLICSLAPPPLVYTRNYLQRDQTLLDGGAAIGFDVVTELVWADRETYDAWIAKVSVPEVSADESRFIDHAQYFAYFVDEHVTSRA
jgi:EthD domain